MTRERALVFLTVAAVLILASLTVEREEALWLFSFLTMAFPIALIVVGVASPERKRKRLRRIRLPLIALTLVLQASGFGMLAFSRDNADVTVLGFPLGAAFMLAGLWLAPLFVVSWAYPRTFDEVVLSREDLDRVRERAGTHARASAR